MKLEGKISVIVVTKDGAELVSRLIRSILDDSDLLNNILDILIVDNGSKDETQRVVSSFGTVTGLKYIRCDENLGFSKAVNLGASFIRGEYILLLNSDIVIPRGEILKLKEVMDVVPKVGVCGPQLVYPDGSLQRSYSHIPCISSEIVPRFLYERLFLKKTSLKVTSLPPQLSIYIVDALLGACLMIRKRTFENLRGLDERFFFFLEETDFCLRVKDIGQVVVFVPYAKIVHDQGRTVKKVWTLGRIEYNISLLKFIKKHHGKWYVSFFVFVRFVKCLLGVLSFLLFPFLFVSAKKRRVFRYYLDLFIWFFKGFPENYGLKRLSPKLNFQGQILSQE